MKIIHQLDEAWRLLSSGKILAYPTEAVYGLGCDPFNEQAVLNLLGLKHRPTSKGLIILIASWEQLTPLIAPVGNELLAPVRKSWPGPFTLVFPKSSLIPNWVSGNHSTIAIRMSAHPTAQLICKHHPVVSTSANLTGSAPARCVAELFEQFPQGIDAIVSGELGGASLPSAIFDVCSGKRLR